MPIYRLPPYTISRVITSLAETIPWSLTATNVPAHWVSTRGKGVIVGIADTGVLPSHPDLLGQVLASRDFTGSPHGAADVQGHGCIGPTEIVLTSFCGAVPIRDLFDRCNGTVHFLPDGAIVKDVSRYDIHTIAWDGSRHVRRKVQAVHKIPYAGEIYRIATPTASLSLTPWHPTYLMTSCRGEDRTVIKKRADELKVGDNVLGVDGSGGPAVEMLSIPFKTIWKCRACGHEATGGVRQTCRKCDIRRWNDGPTFKEKLLDEQVARWLGLVASDGHLMKSQKAVSFSTTEQVLLEDFESLCIAIFGKGTNQRECAQRGYGDIATRKASFECRLCCSDAHAFAEALGIPVGAKSRVIEFPRVISKSPDDVFWAFLAGYVDGNGCVSDNRLRVITGSHSFAVGLRENLIARGWRSSITRCVSRGFESWVVRVPSIPGVIQRTKLKALSTKKCRPVMASRIESIDVQKYDGFMYDLTVENSHNYAANGLIVSNTHVAGTIAAIQGNTVGVAGVAPEAKLVCAKVLGDDGSGRDPWIAAGIDWLVTSGAHVISMSLGSPDPSPLIFAAIKRAVSAGVFVIAAAGNEGRPDSVNYPAAYDGMVAVSAVDREGRLADFSSRGPQVVVAAPGEDIVSTYLRGGYASLSGTSMACPFVAGVTALLLARNKQHDCKSPVTNQRELIEHLQRTAKDAGPAGRDDAFGWGLINPDTMLADECEIAEPDEPDTVPGWTGKEYDVGIGKIHIPAKPGDAMSFTA